ncbi:MAG: hypothetical protein KKA62_04090 [Nanoarchaeota archaeon]|nr:hypothetical protein [Nanoarchaeota archaeon]MBU1643749.1 hypothetical protein [Nanoarchaeota archaeon]MBU1977104.1 hypothetical protein [Nanoarchaeota archaeon]
MLDTHLEKNLIVNSKELEYKGFFRSEEIFRIINKALEEKGYVKREKKSEELVTPAGKMLQLELRPYKIKSNYITLMIKIRVTLDNVTETLKEVEGKKQKYESGDVLIIFDAWSLTDYQSRWGMKPIVYFLKGVFNKFVYGLKFEKSTISELGGDTAYIYAQLKKLFKSYQDKKEETVSEEEVKSKVIEEMKNEEIN